MNATQAQRLLRQFFGKRAGWRYDETAAKADEREQLRAALPAMNQRVEDTKSALHARRSELLHDPLYLRLLDQYQMAAKDRDNTLVRICRRRVSVGRVNGMFFEVMAEGDNWQDAIDAARAKEKA